MNKRLRKKKHVGEFREDGFYIKAQLSFLKNDSPECDKFVDDLIEFVESKNLYIGGGVGTETDVFCTRYKGSCTEDDRQTVSEYLKNHPLVIRFKVGPLVDAWYGSDGKLDWEDSQTEKK